MVGGQCAPETSLEEKALVIKDETVRPHTLAFYQFEKDGFINDGSPHGNTLVRLGNRARHRPSHDSRNIVTVVQRQPVPVR